MKGAIMSTRRFCFFYPGSVVPRVHDVELAGNGTPPPEWRIAVPTMPSFKVFCGIRALTADVWAFQYHPFECCGDGAYVLPGGAPVAMAWHERVISLLKAEIHKAVNFPDTVMGTN